MQVNSPDNCLFGTLDRFNIFEHIFGYYRKQTKIIM